MALMSFPPSDNSHSNPHQRKSKNQKSRTIKKKTKTPPPPPPTATSSWEQFKNLLSCKNGKNVQSPEKKASKRYMKLRSTCSSSICAVRDAVHGSTTARVADHGSSSDGGSHVNESTPLSSARSGRTSGMNLMKFSGCYECHAVDVHSASRRYPRPRTLCPCTECGEVFTKPESLEIHQAIRHAVSELGPEDSSKNIVEIIFKSSWLNRDPPICTISRILKVHNTHRTISRFEEYRDSVKIRSQQLPSNLFAKNPSKNPRCAADGNELLRFYSTSIACSLGSNDSTSLCLSSKHSLPCGICQTVRHGFEATAGKGVGTYATSGRAHELGSRTDCPIRAMLVCRVIAGRVRRIGDAVNNDDVEGYDSFAKDGALEDLFVHDPTAILPCFVVIYEA